MAFTVITDILSYAPEDALPQIESMKMLLHDSDSTYHVEELALNGYLLWSHAQLVQNIMGLLHDQTKSSRGSGKSLTQTLKFSNTPPPPQLKFRHSVEAYCR